MAWIWLWTWLWNTSAVSSSSLVFLHVAYCYRTVSLRVDRLVWIGRSACVAGAAVLMVVSHYSCCQWRSEALPKNWEKERENQEKAGKIAKVLSLCPAWQRGLTTPLLVVEYLRNWSIPSTLERGPCRSLVECHFLCWLHCGFPVWW